MFQIKLYLVFLYLQLAKLCELLQHILEKYLVPSQAITAPFPTDLHISKGSADMQNMESSSMGVNLMNISTRTGTQAMSTNINMSTVIWFTMLDYKAISRNIWEK